VADLQKLLEGLSRIKVSKSMQRKNIMNEYIGLLVSNFIVAYFQTLLKRVCFDTFVGSPASTYRIIISSECISSTVFLRFYKKWSS